MNSSPDKKIQKRKSREAKIAKITAVSSSDSSTKYCKGVYCQRKRPNEDFDWTSKAQKTRKSKCRLCLREERRMKRHEKRAQAFDDWQDELRVLQIVKQYVPNVTIS